MRGRGGEGGNRGGGGEGKGGEQRLQVKYKCLRICIHNLITANYTVFVGVMFCPGDGEAGSSACS